MTVTRLSVALGGRAVAGVTVLCRVGALEQLGAGEQGGLAPRATGNSRPWQARASWAVSFK